MRCYRSFPPVGPIRGFAQLEASQRGGGIGQGQAGIRILFPFWVGVAHGLVDPAPRDGMARVISAGQHRGAILYTDLQAVRSDALVELQHHGLVNLGGPADDLLRHSVLDLLVNALHNLLPKTIESQPTASINKNVSSLSASKYDLQDRFPGLLTTSRESVPLTLVGN